MRETPNRDPPLAPGSDGPVFAMRTERNSIPSHHSPQEAMVPCSRWNGADYVPGSVPSLATESECPVVTARGERSRSRRRDLGRVGQPTRFLGLGNTGKPNNTAILIKSEACGKRVLAPFARRLPDHSLLCDFCLLLSSESAAPAPSVHPSQFCHFQLGPMYHPPKKRRTKIVISDRGFCSGLSNGDRIASAYRNPPTIASPPHRHALNSPSVFLFSQG